MFTKDFWNVVDLDDAGLWVVRLNLTLFGAIALSVMGFKLKDRLGWKRIPVWIRVFTITWTSFWFTIALSIFITGHLPFGEWATTIYGSAYLGMLWGFMWCLWYSTKPNLEGVCDFHDIMLNFMNEELKVKEDVGTPVSVERRRGEES